VFLPSKTVKIYNFDVEENLRFSEPQIERFAGNKKPKVFHLLYFRCRGDVTNKSKICCP